MPKNQPGEFTINEFRTKEPSEAARKIYELLCEKRQITISHQGLEITVSYTTGPSHK